MEKMFLNESSSVSDSDRDRIVEEDDFPANFKEYMRKEGLKCSRSKPDHRWSLSYGLVFWSQHHHQIEPSRSLDNFVDLKVRDKIRYALQKMIWHQNLEASLVQFWAPTKTWEGRTLLRTQYQPFALGKTFNMFERQWLCEYRMRMMGKEYSFYADKECEEEQLGLPGRVFLHRSPESASDVKFYSLKGYPQLDLDVRCRSWGLPVFEHSSQTCVGVLEIVCLCSMDSVLHDKSFLERIYGIFQAQGVTLQLGQLDQRSIDGINNRMNGFSEAENYNLPCPEPLQNGKATRQVDSSDQPPMDPSNNGQNVGTAEGNIIGVTSSKEGTRKGQAREHKQTGVRIDISLEDILKLSEMRRKIAARKLKVSISTLRRNCRSYGITRWPPRVIENVHPFHPSPVVNQRQTPQLSTNLPSNQASASVAHIKPALQDGDMVTVKAKYENGVFKFRLTLLSTLAELQQEVAKRLNQEVGTYSFEYKDEEDDLITIACDEDLQDCIRTSRSLGKASIVVQFKPKQPSTHS